MGPPTDGRPVRPARYPVLSDTDWLETQLESGRSTSDIAETVGCTPAHLRKVIRRLFVPVAPVVSATPGPRTDIAPRPKRVIPDGDTVRELQADHTDLEIGRMFGVSASTIRSVRRKAGIPARPAAPRRRPLQGSEVAALLDAEDRVSEIAAEHGVSRSTVHNRAREAGITLPRGGPCARIDEDWLRHTAPTMTNAQAAAAAGVSERTLRAAKCRLGLTRPSTGTPTADLPVDEIVDAYVIDRIPTREIGARYGVSQQPIREVLHRAGIELRGAGAQRVDVGDVDDLATEYTSGATLGELADRCGVSRSVIRNRLADAGVTIRRRGPRRRRLRDRRSLTGAHELRRGTRRCAPCCVASNCYLSARTLVPSGRPRRSRSPPQSTPPPVRPVDISKGGTWDRQAPARASNQYLPPGPPALHRPMAGVPL